MDPFDQNQKQKLCKKHNQPIFVIDQQQNQQLCPTCISEKPGMIAFDQIQIQKQEIISKSNKQFQQELLQLKNAQDTLLFYRKNIIDAIDKIIQIIIDQIKNTNSFKEKFEQQIGFADQLNILDQLKGQIKNQEDFHQQIIIKVKQLLSEFQQKQIKNFNLDQVFGKYIEKKDNQDDQIQMKLQYELISKVGKQQENPCFSFAFNKNNTILIIGQKGMLIVFQFNDGEIGKELQNLSVSKDCVYCLYFMKQSNCFVSGGMDKLIIWKYKSDNQWYPEQILKDHQSTVNCLLMNKSEDILISGSQDETVKFWKQDQGKWNCQQTIKTDNYVNAISLNELENRLISCGTSQYVIVMEVKDNKQWTIKQKINIDESGQRLCFTFGNQFVFQPLTKDYLEIYNYDSSSSQFKKQASVKVNSCQESFSLFPCQYINTLKILLVKHGEYLNIFRIDEKNNYELIQAIQFDNFHQFGTISPDGQYLITSDTSSKQIYVRRIKQIKF